MFSAIRDVKFRARTLRKAGSTTIKEVQRQYETNLPNSLRGKTITKIKVNTGKDTTSKSSKRKRGMDHELMAAVTFRNEDFAHAQILNFGRKKNIAKISEGKQWKVWGKVPKEQKEERDLKTTKPLNFAFETVIQTYKVMTDGLETEFRKELKVELKKQHKRMKAAAKKAAKGNK